MSEDQRDIKTTMTTGPSALEYLFAHQYSDHDDCPRCGGTNPSTYGPDRFWRPKGFGHSRDCPVASALASLGVNPDYADSHSPPIEYRPTADKHGIVTVKPAGEDPYGEELFNEAHARLGAELEAMARNMTKLDPIGRTYRIKREYPPYHPA